MNRSFEPLRHRSIMTLAWAPGPTACRRAARTSPRVARQSTSRELCTTAAAVTALFLRLRGRLRSFAGRFLVVRCFVESLSGSRCDLAHDFPCGLVVDREETVGAVECFLHFRRKAVFVEARKQLVGEFRLEVVRIRKRRRREFLAAIDDAE